MDFSTRTELTFLSELVAAFKEGAGDAPFFLAGATARDLLLHTAHDIDPGRKTQDVDIALMVSDWPAFTAIRERLINTGRFAEVPRVAHRLVFNGRLPVDFIPFGPVERDDRSIAWPPGGETIMSVFGFAEAMANTIEAVLPHGQRIQVVTLPALAVLKLLAWFERRHEHPGKDAHDLHAILTHYLDAGQRDRLYTDAAQLLDAADFDYTLAGAWLLGQDMTRVLSRQDHAKIADLLEAETDPSGKTRLSGDMPGNAETSFELLQHLARGFIDNTGH